MEIAVRADAKLAEGPRWDAAARRLLWVDIEGCELHVFENGEDRAIRLDAMVGAAAPATPLYQRLTPAGERRFG